MKVNLITTLLFTGIFSFSFGQVSLETKTAIQTEHVQTFEGVYRFTYDGTTHDLDVSSEKGTYVEYDEDGIVLGAGMLLRNSRNYTLKPETVSTYSIVNAPIQFELIDRNETNTKIKILLADDMSEELQLIKL